MSNAYCTTTQLGYFYDVRTIGQLSNDANQRNPDNTRIQFLLDVAASELDTYLAGRYGLPMASPPLVLTRWVAATALDRLFARRVDAPKKVQDDAKWAEDWIRLLITGAVALPGIDRAVLPELVSVESPDGTSRFDALPNFDHAPPGSRTSTG